MLISTWAPVFPGGTNTFSLQDTERGMALKWQSVLSNSNQDDNRTSADNDCSVERINSFILEEMKTQDPEILINI